jgi:TPR repeat protein
MLSIGLLYGSGRGVAQDYAEALRWHRKAADLGNTPAMYMIGMSYEYGQGVPANDAEARLWLKKAAGLGDLAANRWLADHP